MTTRFATFGAALLATTALTVSAVSAETLRWARASEALTLDPHSQNEGPTTTLLHQIYEPLDRAQPTQAKMEPALGRCTGNPPPMTPTFWFLTLREGVTFHGRASVSIAEEPFGLFAEPGRGPRPRTSRSF